MVGLNIDTYINIQVYGMQTIMILLLHEIVYICYVTFISYNTCFLSIGSHSSEILNTWTDA